jgi:CRP-like cAMP-binding protein
MPRSIDQDRSKQLLRSAGIFRSLSDDELDIIGSRFRFRNYRAGITLFVSGDDGDKMFVIASGVVRIQRATESGAMAHIADLTSGEQFGELSLIDGSQRMADAVTVTECDLLVIDRTTFNDCLEASPKIALAIMASLARRLRESADARETRNELDVTGRIADRLLYFARIEGQPQPDGSVRLTERRTHQQLAELVGSVRETVTRALAGLERIGAIRLSGRPSVISIVDQGKLERLCVRK